MAIGSNPIEDDLASTDSTDPAELVHEARKAVKRMRALARLLRDELGEQEFSRVNSSLRDAGRRLAGARDAEVRLATLHELIERHPRALAPARDPSRHARVPATRGHALAPPLDPRGQALAPSSRRPSSEREHEQGREGIRLLEQRLQRERLENSQPSDIDEVLSDIAAMRAELGRLSLVDIDFATLAPGLERIYREGRRRYKRCARTGGCEEQDVHDWRKRVKSLYYALDMLGAKKAKGARRPTRRANRLGDLLGAEHDLWMLCVYVEGHPEAFGADTLARTELLKRIERRRRRQRKRALALGAGLYRRKPGKFTRRIGRALAG